MNGRVLELRAELVTVYERRLAALRETHETPAEHLRNALAVLRELPSPIADPHGWAVAMMGVAGRITMALQQLEGVES